MATVSNGHIVALEGPEAIVKLQAALLPRGRRALTLGDIKPDLDRYEGQVGNNFEARLYILKAHRLYMDRHRVALGFLMGASKEHKRLVFLQGGACRVLALCLKAIRRRSSRDISLAEADLMLTTLVKNGVLGLVRTPEPSPDNTEVGPSNDTEDNPADDPSSRAMRAADELYERTASLDAEPENLFGASTSRFSALSGRDDMTRYHSFARSSVAATSDKVEIGEARAVELHKAERAQRVGPPSPAVPEEQEQESPPAAPEEQEQESSLDSEGKPKISPAVREARRHQALLDLQGKGNTKVHYEAVLPLKEDTVMMLFETTDDPELEFALQAYKEGRYPILEDTAAEDDSNPSSSRTKDDPSQKFIREPPSAHPSDVALQNALRQTLGARITSLELSGFPDSFFSPIPDSDLSEDPGPSVPHKSPIPTFTITAPRTRKAPPPRLELRPFAHGTQSPPETPIAQSPPPRSSSLQYRPFAGAPVVPPHVPGSVSGFASEFASVSGHHHPQPAPPVSPDLTIVSASSGGYAQHTAFWPPFNTEQTQTETSPAKPPGLRKKASRALTHIFGSKKDKSVETNKGEHPLRNKISHPIPMELVEFERNFRQATGLPVESSSPRPGTGAGESYRPGTAPAPTIPFQGGPFEYRPNTAAGEGNNNNIIAEEEDYYDDDDDVLAHASSRRILGRSGIDDAPETQQQTSNTKASKVLGLSLP